MKLTMKEILDKYPDCDMFSLTGGTIRTNITRTEEEYNEKIKNLNPDEINKFIKQFTERYNITEKEIDDAIKDIKEKNKEQLKKIYEKDNGNNPKYPKFEELYSEIEQECLEYNKNLKNPKSAFSCAINIEALVGKTTKYGKEHSFFFRELYFDIATNIGRKNDKKNTVFNNGKSPAERVPKELKDYFLRYEISYYNQVTLSNGLMINYYFILNDKTKEYLLKFKDDFDLSGLEDLALYKNNEVKFCSCTHEHYNSLEN